MREKVIFGNWKMNGSKPDLITFLQQVEQHVTTSTVQAGLALPFTLLETGLAHAKHIKIAAQNVHFAANGAFTGEVSIPMLQEIGIKYVVIGHSERREMFGETDHSVNQKALALLQAHMVPIICCGETLDTKNAGETISFVQHQIQQAYAAISAHDALNTIIAYEPIWAIGTGKTATAADAEQVCGAIRQQLAHMYDQTTADQMVIQYGGSVNPHNIQELMSQANIDGALVGGASLKVDDYLALINYNK